MHSITRRQLLTAAGVAGLGFHGAAAATPIASPVASPLAVEGRLGPCGVNYDLGWGDGLADLSRPASHERFFRDELTAIRDELHASAIGLFGSMPEQLISGLTIAADLGFDIRLQTRLNGLPETEMNERLAVVGAEAERVRQAGLPVVLDVGCEYLLFADGLIEGNDVFEKIDALMSDTVDWDVVVPRFQAMLAGLAATARSIFAGPITYSDAPDSAFVWDAFDLIGVDHYLSSDSAPTYVQTIESLAQLGKPVWVNEFGCPPWTGAAAAGGMAWDIVDYDADPPEIRPGIECDENEQAETILETLSLIEQSPAERAYLYEFISPLSPYSDDPRYDFDLTAYGIVTVFGEDSAHPYDATGYWEPKVAFDALAEWNAERSS